MQPSEPPPPADGVTDAAAIAAAAAQRQATSSSLPLSMAKCVAATADGAQLLVGLHGGAVAHWRRGGGPAAGDAGVGAGGEVSGSSSEAAGLGQGHVGAGAGAGAGAAEPVAVAGNGEAAGHTGAGGWRLLRVMHGHTESVTSVAVSRDGRTAFSTACDKTVGAARTDVWVRIAGAPSISCTPSLLR